jgi:hypothetical protein
MRFALLAALCACGTVVCGSPADAQSNNVRITGLSDVPLGSLGAASDTKLAQNVCAFSGTATKGYRVTASGSGSGGAFTLANGGSTLGYEVQWNGSSGQSTGSNLGANVALGGFTSAATQQQCNTGPTTSASLIVIVRAAEAASATGGNYAGSLTLVIGPE